MQACKLASRKYTRVNSEILRKRSGCHAIMQHLHLKVYDMSIF